MQLTFEQVRAMDVHQSSEEAKKGSTRKKPRQREITFIWTENNYVDMHSVSSGDDCCAL